MKILEEWTFNVQETAIRFFECTHDVEYRQERVLQMNKRRVANCKGDHYTAGWARGFYSCGFEDCGFDDGYRSDDPYAVFGVGSSGRENRLGQSPLVSYRQGYVDGKNARKQESIGRLLDWYHTTIASQRLNGSKRMGRGL